MRTPAAKPKQQYTKRRRSLNRGFVSFLLLLRKKPYSLIREFRLSLSDDTDRLQMVGVLYKLLAHTHNPCPGSMVTHKVKGNFPKSQPALVLNDTWQMQ